MGTLNVEAKLYTTDAGLVIKLIPVSALLIGSFQADMSDHPKPPVLEVKIGNQKRVVENANDPDFVARVKEWENSRSTAMIRLVLALGTDVAPELDWIERYASYFPNPTADNMRVYWLLSKLDTDEANDLFEKIMSLTMPTEEGIKESAEQFQGND